MNVKSKSGSRNTRRRNLLITLLIVVLVSSFAVYLFVTNNGSNGTVHVKNEIGLVKAIEDTKMGASVIIALDKNIDLTATIIIPARKNITLTSNGNNAFKLVGTDRAAALTVETGGTLILDGIVVTHTEGADGWGVNNYGIFIMYSGVISGNTIREGSGGGVFTAGVFEMYDGEIVNNVARVSGGGVCVVGSGASFDMFGGVISGNTASEGGGVYRYGGSGTFNWHGGEISGNTADNGKDIYAP